jgi:hypothetical protein
MGPHGASIRSRRADADDSRQTIAHGPTFLEMGNNNMKAVRVIRGNALRKSLLAASLIAALAGTQGIQAQSITGGLYGSVPAGDKVGVLVASPDTGFKRELQPDAQGRYRASGLNPGRYTVTVTQNGQVIAERRISVNPNSDTAVAAVAAAGATGEADKNTLETVTVTGHSAATAVISIDVSTPEMKSQYSRELINSLPIAASASPETIALLRSNVRYDRNTTGSVQLGGASPAENRFYLNEFDTTNDRTSLGSNRLPREAIEHTETLSGNFGASWTNATGGIMAQTVRQGTNDFQAGYSAYFTPPTSRLLMPRAHDFYGGDDAYFPNRGYNSNNTRNWSATQYLWGSGALIQDKLFAFVLLGDAPPSKTESYSINRQTIRSSRDKNALINLTWNITDSQSFNLIASRDWASSYTNTYRLTENYTTKVGAYSSGSYAPVRQRFLIGNYHWNISDDIELRLMSGFLGQNNDRAHGSEDIPYVDQVDNKTQRTTNIGIQDRTVNFRPDDYWRRGFKGDLTWHLGDHKLVFGAEWYKHFLGQDWHTPLAGWYTYLDNPSTVQLPNGEQVSGKYVHYLFNREFGRMVSINKAAYLEDYWQVSDNVVLYGGVRLDKYINKDALERPLFSFPMTSPRLGVAWDVHGDSSMKVGANIGRYSLSMPSNFSFGVAESHLNEQKWFRYTGMDPTTKAPTGLTQIGSSYIYPGQNGIPPQLYEVSTTNLKAPYQDELQLYVQKALNDRWVGQADFGYAQLKRVISQTCWTPPIEDWAHSHGYPDYADSGNCFEINPGEDVRVVRDFRGDGKLETATISASAFGLPKPKHKYIHLTFDLAHARTEEEPWYLNASYTWTRSFGNDNGFLNLENRNAGYIGQTGIYGIPQILEGADGNLTNDVRHKFVLSGAYFFQNGLRTSAIFNLSSGEPITCFGQQPDVDSISYQWGYWGHWCNTKTTPVGIQTAGTSGRLPWLWQLDLGVGYDWSIGAHNRLSIDLSIQNVTNHRVVTDRYNTFSYDINADNTVVQDINWMVPNQYQAPRTTSLVFRYSFR